MRPDRSGGNFAGPAAPEPEKWLLIVAGVVVLLLMIGIVKSGRDAETSAADQATAYTNASEASPEPAAAAPAATAAPVPAAAVAAPAAAAPAPVAAPPAAPAAAPVAAAPTATASPNVYQGRGDDVLHITKPDGPAILLFECPQCSDNTVVKSDGAEGLLVNTIGAYSGKRWLDVEQGSRTSELVIKATGAWKATVGSVAALAHPSTGSTVSGRGDDVIVMPGSSTAAAITNSGGDGNFVVWVVSDEGEDLAVNTIGGYRGTVQLAAPALVQVTSDGSWSITPQA